LTGHFASEKDKFLKNGMIYKMFLCLNLIPFVAVVVRLVALQKKIISIEIHGGNLARIPN
jgi:hypothetical protein